MNKHTMSHDINLIAIMLSSLYIHIDHNDPLTQPLLTQQTSPAATPITNDRLLYVNKQTCMSTNRPGMPGDIFDQEGS